MLVPYTNLSAEDTEPALKTFDPYAVIKMYSGYRSNDTETGENEKEMAYRLQSNTRAGVKFKIENISAQFELGIYSSVYLRLACVSMDYGTFRITLGQTYSPYSWFAGGDYADDNNMIGFGAAYDGRIPQVRLDAHGFYLTFMTESRNTTGITDGGSSGSVSDTTALAPKTAAGYDFAAGGTILGLGGAFNAVKINDPVSAADGKILASWLLYGHANAVLGDFTLKANAIYGVNSGNFGLMNITNPDTLGSKSGYSFPSSVVQSGSGLEPTRVIAGYINPSCMLTPSLSAGAGVGFAQADNDTFSKKDSQVAYFINFRYTITNCFSILPEFSYREFLKDSDGKAQGSEYYTGVQIQISI